MDKLINKPHLIFLIAIPIVMIVGILFIDATLDINVHDTYFVIAYFHFAALISILFAIIGVGYYLIQKSDRKLSKWLNSTHIGLTFGGTIVVLILTQFYREDVMEYEFNNNLSLSILFVIFLMVLGQLIFPINIIYGLMNKKSQTPG